MSARSHSVEDCYEARNAPGFREAATVVGVCRSQLAALSAAILGDVRAGAAVAMLDALRPTLGDREVAAAPLWSGVCDDASPYEFSVAMRAGAAPDLRLLLEAHAQPASVERYWSAAERLNAALEREFGLSLETWRRIEPLFRPGNADAFFAMYHGLEFRSDGRRLVKLYVNPAASGRDGWDVVADAADALGVGVACRALRRRIPAHARIMLLSIDLADAGRSRFKAYVRYFGASVHELASAYEAGRTALPGDVGTFIDTMTGGKTALCERPVFVTYHLEPDRQEPMHVVLAVPVFPYSPDDVVARQRVLDLLARFEICSEPYRAALATFSQSAQPTVGLHSYVSLQRETQGARITTYFSPLLYARRYGFQALSPQTDFWRSPERCRDTSNT
jgi:DMATS type aromatic prenyltransferase